MIRWVSAPAYAEHISKRLWWQVMFAFVAASLPLWWFLPTVMSGLLILAVSAKMLALWCGQQRWAWAAMMLIVPIGLAQIYLDYPNQGLTFSFIALLALTGAGKLLESRNERDIQVLFLLELTLMMAFLMYSQGFLLFLYLLVALIIAVVVLIRVSQRRSEVVQFARWQEMVKLLGLALPFAMLLFFFFPRIDPLWGIPRHESRAVTGLPDEMQMGDLASLVQSNEIAFRVRFDGELPPPQERYWRGTVLWSFNGERWLQRDRDLRESPPYSYYWSASEYTYTLMPVKSSLKWLPALDRPLDVPQGLTRGAAYQIRLPETHKGPARYRLTSVLAYRGIEPLSDVDLRAALQLPEDLEMAQTRALAERLLRESGHDAGKFAEAFTRYIRSEPFYYTLEPPPGVGDVETFLFDWRMGFCEHYANALALAARSVGIPSRVVIGYQGGEVNPLNNDFVVREESAHAWVELWADGRGWFRVDPTAAVAPERIENARLSAENFSAGDDQRALGTRLADSLSAIAWLRHASDAAQAFWQDWVVDLNRAQQGSLFNALGLAQLTDGLLIVFMMVLTIGAVALLWVVWQRRARSDEDAVARAARRVLARCARRGELVLAGEEFSEFLRRMAEKQEGEQRSKWLRAAQHYQALRYHERGDSTRVIRELRQLRL
ncbi:DUF3488 and transglutaminase-like domain-containing protein [Suttonella sp. R2A3]|uniref:transglutaminase family protein n=1 Tax=Suttonella sp. R2A3 TaxID=2908648 RepID=UPI001F37C889|nr:DUF3488 and transglutaminase-like domain-containing protein [Suttonella sp. R2A3]UJF24988.1 DUF3488 and transglutaminase-like domain-containing protein [Suttonella sp. R2A3]